MSKRSHFELLGGEAGLRAIIDDFVERIFADTMIGFFFARASKARIKAKEYEFAARHLGLDIPYTGNPLPAAHAVHPIMGGHFMRRLQILKDTLASHHVPAEVAEHWVAHTESMRHVITNQAGSECIDPAPHPNPSVEAPPAPPSPTAMPTTTAAPTVTGASTITVNPEPSVTRDATGAPNPTAPSAPAKPVPSAAEIQAYLEASAARTKLRLPLAFARPEADASAAPPTVAAAPKAARPLPLAGASSRTGADSGLQSRTAAPTVSKAADTEISSGEPTPGLKTPK